jgi:hypothetical protein
MNRLSHLTKVLVSDPLNFTFAPGVEVRRRAHDVSVTRVRCMEHAGEWQGVIESWGEDGHLEALIEETVVAGDIVG